ncbi:hypothetical protein GDO86_019477 [Hymenochirus boettgeri]|uniref:Uncharacterized protein n=1 Tax=Hymenochirus boettgeri TaxID=247094 RepID=A0A8T2IGB9_9PIPI|nr:hypothetical protein GDO86_019477 [Hymenochirus boettgeri]
MCPRVGFRMYIWEWTLCTNWIVCKSWSRLHRFIVLPSTQTYSKIPLSPDPKMNIPPFVLAQPVNISNVLSLDSPVILPSQHYLSWVLHSLLPSPSSLTVLSLSFCNCP